MSTTTANAIDFSAILNQMDFEESVESDLYNQHFQLSNQLTNLTPPEFSSKPDQNNFGVGFYRSCFEH